jgi:hypothetical protein
MNAWRNSLPLWISLGLIVWLIHRISLDELLRAAASLPWQLLAPMTVGFVIVLYVWDVFCLLTVFAGNGKPLTYSQMLRVRGRSYLAGVLNQALGQAAVAWDVARIQGTSYIAALSRVALLGWHEGVMLATVALTGSLWTDRPEAMRARLICVILLALLLGTALILGLAPAASRQRLQRTRWGEWLQSWTWRRSVRLVLLRGVYFAIVGSYVALALQICRVSVRPATALTMTPLVLMASVLPSASGLGTRETALCLLFRSAPADVLLAMGLIWSSGVIVVRLAIGLTWLWCGERFELHPIEVQP